MKPCCVAWAAWYTKLMSGHPAPGAMLCCDKCHHRLVFRVLEGLWRDET